MMQTTSSGRSMMTENFVYKHNKQALKIKKEKQLIEQLEKAFPPNKKDVKPEPLF